ncbi:WD repeat-containing protein 44-like [Forsythia ovata]|uniref:WD repeat-containing protein 44-like n=1 Tax=Forsythia ovata TaxID=205694 RepID=A0ABD1X1Q3_9LAMI
MAEPGDIKERRKRLFQGIGLNSNKDFLGVTTAKFVRGVSIKPDVLPHVSKSMAEYSPSEEPKKDEPEPEAEAEASPEAPIVLVRSRSDGDIESFSMKTKKRKEELIGPVSKQRLTRTSSGQIAYSTGVCQYACSVRISQPKRARTKSALRNSELLQSVLSPGAFDSFFLIKNLDTGKEFIVKESNEKGMWNKLNDVHRPGHIGFWGIDRGRWRSCGGIGGGICRWNPGVGEVGKIRPIDTPTKRLTRSLTKMESPEQGKKTNLQSKQNFKCLDMPTPINVTNSDQNMYGVNIGHRRRMMSCSLNDLPKTQNISK